MIKHTFLNKCNTLICNSKYNTGFNPVAELNVGKTITRVIFDVDLIDLQSYISENKVKTNALQHFLKFKNCGNVNLPVFDKTVVSDGLRKKRASSFNVILFTIPYYWDGGRGVDYHGDYVKGSHKMLSTDGSNWYQPGNGYTWDEEGIYSYETLKNEYEKYNAGQESIIIGVQHFDNGAENFNIDVTTYMNKVLNGEVKHNGFGMAFAPDYEINTTENKFVSFFTHHTNTYFVPYLETINNDVVINDRYNFYIGKNNKLYFFVKINNEFVDLDENPVCTIEGETFPVTHAGKGIYYVEVLYKKGDVEPNTFMSDIWGNLILEGEILEDIELEFFVLPMENRITLGNDKNSQPAIYPQVYGINQKECLNIDEQHEVHVEFIEEYTSGKQYLPTKPLYRIYIKEGNREIDIFEYHPLELYSEEYSFIINTKELIPNTYYVDIKIKDNKTFKIFKEVLTFQIVNNITNMLY